MSPLLLAIYFRMVHITFRNGPCEIKSMPFGAESRARTHARIGYIAINLHLLSPSLCLSIVSLPPRLQSRLREPASSEASTTVGYQEPTRRAFFSHCGRCNIDNDSQRLLRRLVDASVGINTVTCDTARLRFTLLFAVAIRRIDAGRYFRKLSAGITTQ